MFAMGQNLRCWIQAGNSYRCPANQLHPFRRVHFLDVRHMDLGDINEFLQGLHQALVLTLY